jgi:hypothetical protein
MTRDWSRASPAVTVDAMPHKGWHSRNYLPHFDSEGVVQFVTFRLADSLPREALARLAAGDRPETLRHEMLDRGWGACWLGPIRSRSLSITRSWNSMASAIGYTLGP